MKNFCVFILVFSVLLSCNSSEVREVDMDNILEEELRADPDIFKDSKTLKGNGKENVIKSSSKK